MIGYDIARTLPQLRAEAESRMTETVRIGSFRDGTDEDTGDPTRVLVTLRYEGKARVKYPVGAPGSQDGAGSPVSITNPVVSIPHSSPVAFEGDEVVVEDSTADGALVGRRYTITGPATAGQTTAHRYPVRELS